jgi:O-antigen ligase
MATVWSTSRGGLLGLTAGLIYIALFVNYSRIKKVFWLMFTASYLIIMPLMTIALVFSKGKASSGNERIIIIKGALGMIKAHPFLGTGIGTFMDRCASYTNSLGGYYAHNCYLQICAETGAFSLVSFLLLTGYIFYRSIKAILNAPGSPNSLILIGLNAGLLGFLVHSFFEINLYSFQHSFLFWVVMGLTVALTQKVREQHACSDGRIPFGD